MTGARDSAGVEEQPDPRVRRFYDGGWTDEAPDPTTPATVALERTEEMPEEDFRMTRRIAYLDRELGELVVPAHPDTFVTDLASIPSVFTWLVPRTGTHLRAALVHDALLEERGVGPAYIGPAHIPPETAHRVLRDALADSGTGLVRRWLMWTGVMLATMLDARGTGWSTAERWRWRLTALGSLAVITLLGVLATLDIVGLEVPLIGEVPWTGEGPWWARLGTGAAGAVVIPCAIGLTWGRFRVVGVLTGVLLALLLHVTIAVGLLTGLYTAAEWLCRRSPRAAAGLAGVIVVTAVVTFVTAW